MKTMTAARYIKRAPAKPAFARSPYSVRMVEVVGGRECGCHVELTCVCGQTMPVDRRHEVTVGRRP